MNLNYDEINTVSMNVTIYPMNVLNLRLNVFRRNKLSEIYFGFLLKYQTIYKKYFFYGKRVG